MLALRCRLTYSDALRLLDLYARRLRLGKIATLIVLDRYDIADNITKGFLSTVFIAIRPLKYLVLKSFACFLA